MKNQFILKYTIIILLFNILFVTNIFATATNTCNYYNQQYDKYSYLVSITPDVDTIKNDFIDKMDFYDMKIFHYDSCDLRTPQKSIRTYDFVDEMFE
ncbi:MAG: hypothetical protein ACI9TV_001634 [Sulfurimonas sp.]|jgi:hypothetical protein|uniref:hypothetical protein n=1 Tax=Sulfurimonas sp. TaxID=2022749 RepID=UPI0039E55FBF